MQIASTELKQSCLATLKTFIGDSNKIWGNTTAITLTGTSRKVRFYTVHGGEIMDITFYIAVVLDLPRAKGSGDIIKKDCNMNVLDALTFDLNVMIGGDGFNPVKLKQL